VGAHAPHVGPALIAGDDVVADRVGQQAQGGDRRAQVVRDRGHELMAGRLGPVARRLLAGQPGDHHVGRVGHLTELVVGRGGDDDLPRPGAHRLETVADRV